MSTKLVCLLLLLPCIYSITLNAEVAIQDETLVSFFVTKFETNILESFLSAELQGSICEAFTVQDLVTRCSDPSPYTFVLTTSLIVMKYLNELANPHFVIILPSSIKIQFPHYNLAIFKTRVFNQVRSIIKKHQVKQLLFKLYCSYLISLLKRILQSGNAFKHHLFLHPRLCLRLIR